MNTPQNDAPTPSNASSPTTTTAASMTPASVASPSAVSPAVSNTTNSASQQWTDRIPLAPNMATLLFHLRDVPFSCAQDRMKGSTAHERTPSLYVLMRTLTAQAEHDGFR